MSDVISVSTAAGALAVDPVLRFGFSLRSTVCGFLDFLAPNQDGTANGWKGCTGHGLGDFQGR